MHAYIRCSPVILDSNIVWLRSLQCVTFGKATRHHSHDRCNREELECNTKEGSFRRQADILLYNNFIRSQATESRPPSQVWPQENYYKNTPLCFLSRPRTTSLAASCWNSPWQSVPTCWPLASRCRKSVKGAAASFQLTTPPSPAFTYSQPGRRCGDPMFRPIKGSLFLIDLCFFFVNVAHQQTLLNGSMNCQMACYWLRRLWQGSLPYTWVGKSSVFLRRLDVRCSLSPTLVFFFFLQWWSLSATSTALSLYGEKVHSVIAGGVWLYLLCKSVVLIIIFNTGVLHVQALLVIKNNWLFSPGDPLLCVHAKML